ncbi:MAG: D-glycero-alpha-D-manno-heptose-1,7-bisphosphate 7-phosphatase [Planctomycetota bacterium]|jgi:D-glycero-D-manno-heptose 1,7-bisphosphate phosphatase
MSNKAVFLDRDDTLIKDPGYINDPSQVILLSGASEALIELKEMGYKRVIVTNQSGVARAIVTEGVLRKIHKRLQKLLEHEGAGIEGIYYCPYHPEGVIEKYRRESDLRKPNPGMILAAAKDMDIDLERSWAIGNSYRDILAGQRAGCKTILINSAFDQTYRRPTDPVPDKQAVNLKEAVNIIKMYDRKNRMSEAASSQEKIEPAFEAEGLDIHTETIQHGQDQQKRQPVEVPMKVKQEEAEASRTHKLLEEMLRHIKEIQREGMFEEFSLAKVVAGIVQALVLLCLFLSLLFLTDHTKSASSVHTMIGYAIVLQLMVIAFYMMRDRK